MRAWIVLMVVGLAGCGGGARRGGGARGELAGVVESAVSVTFACARTQAGRVYCWGRNDHGQLGDGTAEDSAFPLELKLAGARSLAVAPNHACAAADDGRVFCWGDNAAAQLGDGSTSERHAPVAVTGVSDAVEVATGTLHTCARRRAGGVVCWGGGQPPAAVAGLDDAVQIAVASHACALRAGGDLYCWGDNAAGQLGDETRQSRDIPAPVLHLPPAVQVSARGATTCAVVRDGRAFCWGLQGGDVETGDIVATTPVALPGVTDAAAVSASLAPCVRRRGGSVACTRPRFDSDQLPSRLLGYAAAATVPGLTGATHLASDELLHCATRAGRLLCWGSNVFGGVGDGTRGYELEPRTVADLGDAQAVALGQSHACALRASGQVVCWGANASGQLGDGTTTSRETPAPVRDLPPARALAAGGLHSCAVTRAGALYCWGSVSTGAPGLGNPRATAWPGLGDLSAVALGPDHFCVLTRTGTVRCWGHSGHGELGQTLSTDPPTPIDVPGIADAVQISAGASHTCALRRSGRVACWGGNWHGQVGDGTQRWPAPPADVPGIDDAREVAASWAHTCVTRGSGRVTCWGYNADGQVDGTPTPPRAVDGAPGPARPPTDSAGLTDAAHVAGGQLHTCAVRAGGTVTCWGNHGHRHRAAPSAAPAPPTPAPVVDFTDAAAIAAGPHRTCVLRRTGQVACWGQDPTAGSRAAPTVVVLP